MRLRTISLATLAVVAVPLPSMARADLAPPNSPDPSAMTLQLADLPAGTTVDTEQAVQADDGPGYDRSFDVPLSAIGSSRLSYLGTEVDLASSPAVAAGSVRRYYLALSTKLGRALFVREFVARTGKQLHVKRKNVKVGKGQTLAVGDGGYAFRVTVKARALRLSLQLVTFSVDRAEGMVVAVSAPGSRLLLGDLTPLLTVQADHMHAALFPQPSPANR